MYYVSILHRVPYTTVEYTTETYFIDESAANEWIDKIFMPHEFHPDLCTIVGKGPASWSKIGVLCQGEGE